MQHQDYMFSFTVIICCGGGGLHLLHMAWSQLLVAVSDMQHCSADLEVPASMTGLSP